MPELLLDLQTAAHRRLVGFPTFHRLVADGWVGTDALDTDSLEAKLAKAWAFQGLDSEGRPFRDPEGSGTGVVVVQSMRPWTGSNAHNTAHFPELQVLIYADCTRDSAGGVTASDAKRKVNHIATLLDQCFHLPGNQEVDQYWSTLRVHASIKSGGLDVREIPGTDAKTLLGEQRYEISTD